MLEQAGRFFVRDKYIDPRYEEEINDYINQQELMKHLTQKKKQEEVQNYLEARFANNYGGNRFIQIANFKKKEVAGYEEGIMRAKKVFWPLLFSCALFTDFSDFFPVVGTIIKIITLPIIWYHVYIKLRAHKWMDDKFKVEVSWRVRFIFRLLGIIDIIPFLNALPLTTLSIFLIWWKSRSLVSTKEKEVVEAERQRKKWTAEARALAAARERQETAAKEMAASTEIA